MKTIVLSKSDRALKGSLVLPASKSISNRLLIIRALSGSGFPIDNLSDSEDTSLLKEILAMICPAGSPVKVTEIDTRNAGTVMRFLTGYLAFRPGKWVLTGSERMKQRPIGNLVDALKNLGADIEYLSRIGYPPILIKGRTPITNETTIECGISSQFCSSLLLIAPYFPEGLTLHMKGQPVSSPYIDMTLALMEYFGIRIRKTGHKIKINPGLYEGRRFSVESDWSAAAFWYEAAALADVVDLELLGLRRESTQGDAILARIYQSFGVNTEYRKEGVRLTKDGKTTDGYFFDFTDYPDIAPAVIITCAALGMNGRFEGLKSLRVKETDRVRALQNEIEKIGIGVTTETMENQMPIIEFGASSLRLRPETSIETYGDHRMAMAFAPLALKTGVIRITNPDVVMKSYPGFWEHMQHLGFEIR